MRVGREAAWRTATTERAGVGARARRLSVTGRQLERTLQSGSVGDEGGVAGREGRAVYKGETVPAGRGFGRGE